MRICISQNHHFFSDVKIRSHDRGAVDLGGLEDETIYCLLCFFGVIFLAWFYLKLCLDCNKLLEVVAYVGPVLLTHTAFRFSAIEPVLVIMVIVILIVKNN